LCCASRRKAERATRWCWCCCAAKQPPSCCWRCSKCAATKCRAAGACGRRPKESSGSKCRGTCPTEERPCVYWRGDKWEQRRYDPEKVCLWEPTQRGHLLLTQMQGHLSHQTESLCVCVGGGEQKGK
jgi:hypothetical protein